MGQQMGQVAPQNAKSATETIATILNNAQARRIYSAIVTERIRMQIDPDFANGKLRDAAEESANVLVELTAAYLRYSAALSDAITDRVAATAQAHTHAQQPEARAYADAGTGAYGGATAAAFEAAQEQQREQPTTTDMSNQYSALVANIWNPLPDAEQTDFYWIEAIYAAMCSNAIALRAVTDERITPVWSQHEEWIWWGIQDMLTELFATARQSFRVRATIHISARQSFRATILILTEPLFGAQNAALMHDFDQDIQRDTTDVIALPAIDFGDDEADARGQWLEPSLLSLSGVMTQWRTATTKLAGVGATQGVFEDTFTGDPIVWDREHWRAKKASREEVTPLPHDSTATPTTASAIPDVTESVTPSTAPQIQPPIPEQAPNQQQTPYRTVWFMTNRKAEPTQRGSNRTGTRFAADPDDDNVNKWHSSYGSCSVYVTQGANGLHAQIESGESFQANRETFLNNLTAQLPNAQEGSPVQEDRRRVLLYTHGFNTSFKDAILSAARLAVALDFSGPIICYSWPSKHLFADLSNVAQTQHPLDMVLNRLKNLLPDSNPVRIYHTCQDRAEQSSQHFAAFLRSLETLHVPIHLVAHSMGCLTLLKTLEELWTPGDNSPQVDQVVLIAADADPELLGCAALSTQHDSYVTLYASECDRALQISETSWFNGRPRIGLIPPVASAPGGDTVNVTHAPGKALTVSAIVGHSYYIEVRAIIEDIAQVLNNGHTPIQRHLVQRTFWEFPASE